MSIPAEFKEITDFIVRTAGEFMSEDQELVPVIFMGNQNKIEILPMMMPDVQAKNKLNAVLHAMSELLKPTFVLWLTESWVAEGEKTLQWRKDHPDESLENCPWRKECVMFSFETLNGNWLAQSEIKTSEDGKRFFDYPEFIKPDYVGGRFVNLLHQPVTH